MRLTLRTNLAMRTLMYCAVHRDCLVRKHDIADACNASENHLGVVVNQLAQAGYVHTSRGRNGGVRLACDPATTSVGEVVRLFESGTPFAECFPGAENTCPLTCACRLRRAFERGLAAFYAELDAVSLADLVQGNDALADLLSLTPA